MNKEQASEVVDQRLEDRKPAPTIPTPALVLEIGRVQADLQSAMRNGSKYFVTRISRDYLVTDKYDGFEPVDRRGLVRPYDSYPKVEHQVAFALIKDPLKILVGEVRVGRGFVQADGMRYSPGEVLFWTYVRDQSYIVLRAEALRMHDRF